jgi:hypothetical protein
MFFSIGRKTRARVIEARVFQQLWQSRALAELITKQKGGMASK